MKTICGRWLAFSAFFLASSPSFALSDYRVTQFTIATQNGGRVAWGKSNNMIAFDRANSQGYYDVFVVSPTGNFDTDAICLTCGATATIGTLNKGNPDWHPSGNFLAVQIQKAPTGSEEEWRGRPGQGLDNDLYIMDAAGARYWQVTNVVVGSGGVLHPHFSYDGNKLLWAEEIATDTIPGTWKLRVGDFVVASDGTPSVQNIVDYQPGQQHQFYESHGWSLDDSTIFFSGNLEPGQTLDGRDIYSYNLASGTLKNLTNSMNVTDEHARTMPGTGKLIWMRGAPLTDTTGNDYYVMDPDGSNQERVTFFNDSRSPSYQGKSLATTDSDWSPDGTMVVGYIEYGGTQGVGGTGAIFLYNIEQASTPASAATYLRPPVASGSIVSVFDGRSQLATGSASASGSVPTDLAGSSATITDAKGNQTPAQFFFASPGQVNLYIPDGIAPGPGTLQITSSNGDQSRATFEIENVAPGIFSANAIGDGPPAAFVSQFDNGLESSSNFVFSCGGGNCTPSPIDLSGPAQTYLTLFATGVKNRSELSAVSVRIGDTVLPASFAGAQPGNLGLDQVNVFLPQSLMGSGQQQIILTVDGVDSPPLELDFQ